jgi:hypothetical protein
VAQQRRKGKLTQQQYDILADTPENGNYLW